MVCRHDFIFIGNGRCGHVSNGDDSMNDDIISKTDEILCKIKDRINQEIEELKVNGEKHSDDVRQNGLLIAEGLRVALRIIWEVEEENDEETNKNNSLVGKRNE